MSTVSTARAELGKALSKALGRGFNVFPGDTSSAPSKPTLYLERSSIAPIPGASMLTHQYETTFTLTLVVGPNAGESSLEDSLDALIVALEDSTGTVWTDARRGLRDGLYPAYEITLTTPTQRN